MVSAAATLPRSQAVEHRIFSLCVLSGCTWVCFRSLKNYGYEGPWLRIDQIMSFSADPPFGHRLLFVLLAKAVKGVFPAFSDMKCFLFSQLAAILLALGAIRKWGELFVPAGLESLPQLLLVLIVLPTMSYFNFFDFGILFTFSACLFFLVRDRFLPYLLLLGLGTLNHENSALLIPVFVAVSVGVKPLNRRFWIRLVLQGLVYGAVRLLLFVVLPAHQGLTPRLGTNLNLLSHELPMLGHRYLGTVFWYAIALLGLRHAPGVLRRCTILLPLLFVTSLVYGELNETRLFDAFIPIVVALVCCYFSRRLLGRDPVLEPGEESSEIQIAQPAKAGRRK